MDLLDLIKAGSLIFSRDPTRAFAAVDAMKEDRQNKQVIQNVFGAPTFRGQDGTEITWEGARATPSGNVSMATGAYPDFTSGNRLPPVPRAFIPEVRQQGMEEQKRQLMAAPAFQQLAAKSQFTPPPTGKDRYVDGQAGVFDTVLRAMVPGTAALPKPPTEIQVAMFQAENDPAKAREILNAKGIKGEWALNAGNGKMEYVPENKLLSAAPGTYMRPPSGFKITSDGNGGFEVATGDMAGGSSGLTKPTVGKLEENLMKANEGFARLKAIEGQFKPEYQQLGTRWQSFATALKDKAGMPVDPGARAQLEDYSAYRAGAIDNLTKYIQEVTGAAMGIQEGERITKGMPNPGQGLFDGDSPIEFQSKMGATMKRLGDVQMRMNYALKHGLSQDAMLAIPLDSIPQLVDQRGDALEREVRAQNPNMPVEQIEATVKERLRQEFGLQ